MFMRPAEWLTIVQREYLQSFIRDGGATVSSSFQPKRSTTADYDKACAVLPKLKGTSSPGSMPRRPVCT